MIETIHAMCARGFTEELEVKMAAAQVYSDAIFLPVAMLTATSSRTTLVQLQSVFINKNRRITRIGKPPKQFPNPSQINLAYKE